MRDEETNEIRAREPLPGDYWHEMFTPILVVLDAGPETIVFCRQIERVDKDHWRFNLKLTERLPRSVFYDLLHYKTEGMKHKCHADVIPGHCPLEVKAWWESAVTSWRVLTVLWEVRKVTDIVERLRDDRIDSMHYQRAEAADEIERLRKALQFIADGYDNQDVNHVNYRVRVYQVALDALSSTDGKTP